MSCGVQTTDGETQHKSQKFHYGNKGSHLQMTKKTTEEQEQDKTPKSSTSGHGDNPVSILQNGKLDILKCDLLDRIFSPKITSQQCDSLKNHLSNLSYCPLHQFGKKVSELQLCISDVQEAIHDLQIKEICNSIQHLLCSKLKWRSCRQMAIKELDIKDECEQTFNMISQFVKTRNGAVINSFDLNIISCYNGDKYFQTIKCCSLVTDMTRTEDKVMATLSYSKKIIIIGSTGSQLLNIYNGYRMISHVGGSTFVGSSMYSRTLYLVNWKIKLNDGIIHEFKIKDYPSDIAVGPRQHILTTFANINCVACYNLKGDLLFKLDSVSKLPLNMPTRIFADCRFFYFIESEERRLNRVSALGGVSQVKLPIIANNMDIDKHTITLWNSLGKSCILETGEHFWPNEIYFHRAQTPTIDRHVYINNATDVQDILMVSDSRVILIYWGRQIVLINGDNIDKSLLGSLELNWQPTAFCRWNQTQILVSFSEGKTIQFISWKGDKLEIKSELKTTVGYVQVTNKATNEVVGLTVSPQPQGHMILTKDNRVTVIAIIDLEHGNVSIAASPVNLLVADIDKCKLVFFSFCGKQLSEKKLRIEQRPWLVYSNGSHFYVVTASRPLIVDCYNICGHFEQEFKLTSHRLPQIGALNGTLSVVDTAYRRVLFYRHHNWDTCQLEVKSDNDSWTIDIHYGKRQKKVMIGAMCLLDGQMAIADWGEEFQLLLISRNGDIVKQHPLPSLATDICRWGNYQFGVILPIEKQLWFFNCISFEKISLAQPYIRVCQFDDTRAVCYCDRPSCLDLVTVKGPFQGNVAHITGSPDYIKSIAVRHDTKDILTWDSNRLQSYNIINSHPKKDTLLQQTQSFLGIRLRVELGYSWDSSHLLSNNITTTISPKKDTLFQQGQSLLGGGCTDETLLYLTYKGRLFSLSGESQVITEYFSGYTLGVIEQVDVLFGYISGNELLSSTIHFQDLTVTERGQHYTIPYSSEDRYGIFISDVVIMDNNLIAVCDYGNKNLKILSFKGRLLGTLPLESSPSGVCQWAPNTLAVTLEYKKTLLTVKVQFPLTYRKHETRRPYKYITALSDGRLVCSWTVGDGGEDNYQSEVDIVNIEKLTNHCIVVMEGKIKGVTVIHQDIIVVSSQKGYGRENIFFFFSCSGQRLHKVDHVVSQIIQPFSITSDDTNIYVTGKLAIFCPSCVVCLSRRAQYKRVFLHHTQRIMPNSTRDFRAIDCRGPRMVVATDSDSLYVQGLTIDREALPVSRLQVSPVQITELDVSSQGNTIICDTVNHFIMLLKFDGQLICQKSLAAGGVCFMGEAYALVTIPHTSQLFALDVNNALDTVKRWNTQVPYGRIRRLEQNLCFLCFHINLTVQHKIKVVGDTLEIVKSEQNPKTGNVTEHGTDSTGRPKLWATCGNYVASSRVESDSISGRQLPWRSSQFAISTETDIFNVHVALLTDDTVVISDCDRKTITLTTLKGHILYEIHTDTGPWDICQWTDDTFIVNFPDSKELVFYNHSPIKTIHTEKGYHYICKNKDNHLICGTKGEEYFESGKRKYRGAYIDILSVRNGSVICSKDVTDGRILSLGVTHFSVVALIGIIEIDEKDRTYISPDLCWYTGQGLHLYREKRTFPPEVDVRNPKQIAIHGKDIYLLVSGKIYCISPTDTCELYLNREQTDCYYITSINISKSHLIITGELSSKTLGVRVYDINCP